MEHFMFNVGLWIVIIVECLIGLVLISFFIFGGHIELSIKLNGPLRFLSKHESGGDSER